MVPPSPAKAISPAGSASSTRGSSPTDGLEFLLNPCVHIARAQRRRGFARGHALPRCSTRRTAVSHITRGSSFEQRGFAGLARRHARRVLNDAPRCGLAHQIMLSVTHCISRAG